MATPEKQVVLVEYLCNFIPNKLFLDRNQGEAILQDVSVGGHLPQTRQCAHHADDAESTHHAREVGHGLSSFTHRGTKEQQLSTAKAILICVSKWRN